MKDMYQDGVSDYKILHNNQIWKDIEKGYDSIKYILIIKTKCAFNGRIV